MSNSSFREVMRRHRLKRNTQFEKLIAQGYIYAYVTSFNNSKGYGMCEDNLGKKYSLHYTNMNRAHYKLLTKNQQIHFKPSLYNGAPTALDIAIVY